MKTCPDCGGPTAWSYALSCHVCDYCGLAVVKGADR